MVGSELVWMILVWTRSFQTGLDKTGLSWIPRCLEILICWVLCRTFVEIPGPSTIRLLQWAQCSIVGSTLFGIVLLGRMVLWYPNPWGKLYCPYQRHSQIRAIDSVYIWGCVHVLSTFCKLVAHPHIHTLNFSLVFLVLFRSVVLLSMFAQHDNTMLKLVLYYCYSTH